ncbi:kanadaptin isoform X2 [Mixophyes fleayi]|uniref:kanadaptin isoform X2 n=1 Tax=Mixophyes fleayi TaxID=3061075 RepID=UPI003F4E1AA9
MAVHAGTCSSPRLHTPHSPAAGPSGLHFRPGRIGGDVRHHVTGSPAHIRCEPSSRCTDCTESDPAVSGTRSWESGAGYMEAAQLDPDGGEWPSVPGALEAGDPARSPETAAHGDAQPPVPGEHEETGSGHTGAGSSKNEGPGGAQGAGDPRARDNEGPGWCEGHGDAGARNTRGPDDAGARNSRGPQDPGARNTRGPQDPRANEGARAGGNEVPGNVSTRCTEGPRSPRAGSRTGATEGSGKPSPRSNEGSRHPPPGSSEGCRDAARRGHDGSSYALTSGSKGHELPRDTTEGTNVPRATDQWVAGSGGTERTHGSGTCGEERSGSNVNEELDALGTSCPTKSDDAGTNSPKELSDPGASTPEEQPRKGHGSNDATMEGSQDSRGTESFKKPIAAPRPNWNEKTVEQRNKSPISTQLSPSVTIRGAERETAQDLSTRLPSDAYRTSPAIPYREPSWAGLPESLYSLEVLKGGSVLSTKSINGVSFTVFGRLPGCHVPLEHPSVSRYHAVLQYRLVPGPEPDEEPGFYVYDLGSTHGTFINKQRIQSKTYCRFRVGHVLKFGGSTRLFILQGPDDDQEAESEMTVTQIKEARREKETLQKRMLGDDSDEEEEDGQHEERGGKEQGESGSGSGCTWGMGDDAIEEENDENPIALEFQEEREALYLKDPKKALQGFYDREGEELEFEYDEHGPGSWLCRVKLPVDDSSGKQLVAEITHSGKKKDAARLCSLEACRMLEMRGLLRQEAVARKRKAKRWEDEDFYDSDDDTFLDRTGIVEKKRLNRMKKAGKIGDKPDTFESLTAKLDVVEKEIAEVASRLKTTQTGEAQNSAQDPLDAFMTEIKAASTLDSVTRKKLNLQSLELRKEQQRLKTLIKIVQPVQLPELNKPKTDNSQTEQDPKTKKLTLPMFGAMKGGRKFKLKTGTVGKLPLKRTDLPDSLFTMKDERNDPEEEEDEEDNMQVDSRPETGPARTEAAEQSTSSDPGYGVQHALDEEKVQKTPEVSSSSGRVRALPGQKPLVTHSEEMPKTAVMKQKKMQGPSRPPQAVVSSNYPEDDPDYCVWTPPTGQTGDGKTHLNEKYGY